MKYSNLFLFTILLILNFNFSIAQTMPDLAKTLDSIYDEDQKYRKQMGPIMKEYGQKSDEFQELAMNMIKTDASNLVIVKQILDNHGWLGPDAVGEKANQSLFMVIQHADLETQQKYMPMMEEAISKGNAKSQNYALMKDRVLLGEGKKQLYGSQIGMNQITGNYYVKPLKNPENVNERRAEMGLGPIEDYVSRWNMEWSVENYEKALEASKN